MPRKAKSTRKRTTKKRPAFARARGGNQIGSVSANVRQMSSITVGPPLCWNVKLRYCDRQRIDTVTQGTTDMWNLSSLFDPQVAVGGHQPLFFDRFENMYSEYLVTGAKITITLSQDNDGDYPATIFWSVKDTTTVSSTTIRNAMEQGSRTICNLGYAGGGAPVKSISQYVNIAKLHGIKGKLSPKNIPFTAKTTTNPTKGTFGALQYFAADEVSNIALNYIITIDYYCCFFNRKEQAEN